MTDQIGNSRTIQNHSYVKNLKKDSTSKVTVVIRCRPFLKNEDSNNVAPFELQDKMVQFEDNTAFQFDHVFGPKHTTKDIYVNVISDIIQSVCDGYNVTIFAYGQTASGKTYTMMGNDKTPGITRHAMKQIFDHIESNTDQNRSYLLRVSYLEIYNEKIYDLLSKDLKCVNIFTDANKSISFDHLTEVFITNISDVMDVINRGESFRKIAKTQFNERSSRSHTIFRMVIERRDVIMPDMDPNASLGRKKKNEIIRIGQLNLVDLAGSENASLHDDNERRTEGRNINLSLLHLKDIIVKLSKKEKVPSFRNSKLTRILGESLSGNAKIAVICNISPFNDHYEQSKRTLEFVHVSITDFFRFGSCASKITIKPTVNSECENAIILKYQREIEELTKERDLLRAKIRERESLQSNGSVSGDLNTMSDAERLKEEELAEVVGHLGKYILGNKKLQQQLKTIEAEKKEKEEKMKELEMDMKNLEQKLKEQKAAEERIEAEKREKEKEFNRIQKERQSLQDQIQKYEEKMNELENSVSALSEQVKEGQEEKNKLLEEAKSKSQTIENLIRQQKEIEELLEKERNEKLQLEQFIAQKDVEIIKAKEMQENTLREIKKIESENQKIKEELSSWNSTLLVIDEMYKQDVRDQQKLIYESDYHLSKVYSELYEKEQENEKLKAEIEELRKKLQEFEKNTESFKKNTNMVSNLMEYVEFLEKQKQDLIKDHTEATVCWENKQAEYERLLQLKDEEIMRLRTEIETIMK